MNATTTPQKLSDVKISCFVAPSDIEIPSEVPQFAQKSNDDPTLSQSNEKNSKIVIQKGEKVYILKTPKGCYLRTQDKKYIALRNKSLEESFMLGNSNNNNSPQIIPQDKCQQETSSYASANGQNFEQTPNYSSYYNGNSNNNNNNITSQAQVAQLDLSSNMLVSLHRKQYDLHNNELVKRR
jgi:hypothetical protein